MDQTDPKWYLLGIILLVLSAIMIPRWFHGPAYSDQQAHKICSDIFVKYSTLVESDASNDQWEAFQSEALPQLEAIAADHEANIKQKSPGSRIIYQVARHRLPTTIQQRGNLTNEQLPDLIVREMADAERIIMAPQKPSIKPRDSQSDPVQSWDPLIATILIGDSVLVIAGIGYWFRRKWL